YFLSTNGCSIRDYGIFLDYNDTILYRIMLKVSVGKVFSAYYPYIIANTAILVQNGVLDITTLPHPDRRRLLGIGQLHHFVQFFVVVSTHHVRLPYDRASTNTRTHTNNG